MKPRSKRRKIRFPLLLQWLLALLFLTAAFIWQEERVSLQPNAILSTDLSHDLLRPFLQSLTEAKSSIWIFTYHLTDPKIISLLNKKADEKLDVHIIVDAATSLDLSQKLSPKIKLTQRSSFGLMHTKFTVLDEERVWTGSANLTTDSLKRQSNLLIFVDDPLFAKEVIALGKLYETPSAHDLLPSMQSRKVTLLPSPHDAPIAIRSLLQSAQKTIQVAMYTFTRTDFAEELIQAQKRGIKVEVILDRQMSVGASKKIAALLKKNKIPLFVKETKGLMHHKMAIIDHQRLIYGSANWTKAAFCQNDDYFIVLDTLSEENTKALQKLWNALLQKSSPL